jgi:uncharacterized repeat protein (TIGR03803 family)
VVNPFVQTQTFTVLHAFQGPPDGYSPYGGVVLDRDGNLYGVTYTGGNYKNGVIYKVDPAGNETILHRLSHHEGCCSSGSLLLDGSGNLYGTTSEAGSRNAGTIFELTRSGKLVVLHEFGQGGIPEEGARPLAGLIRDEVGNLYGTGSVGGNCCNGNIFKLNHATKVETVLYAFGQLPDGFFPEAPLTLDDAGNLYGTTGGGGLCCGTIFRLDPTGVETILWDFTGGSDGSGATGLIRDSAGTLYGTTYAGGDKGGGTIFKLEQSGAFTLLHTFGESVPDGFASAAGLVADDQGNLYGTTVFGGLYGDGAVFKLSQDGAFTVVHSFAWGTDGAFPWAPLVRDAAGNLYGTATQGGDPLCDCGVVFKITP